MKAFADSRRCCASMRLQNTFSGRALMACLLSLVIFAHPAAWSAQQPPKNPYLADSLYPLGHGGPAQQDSLAVSGLEGSPRQLKPGEIQYSHVGPGFFSVLTSGLYANDKRVLWGNGLDRIVKIDHTTHPDRDCLRPMRAI